MEGENPVYLKFGYYESLGAKRSVLSSQVSLLNLVKIMRRYNTLRKEELRIKSNLSKSIKELNAKVKETKSYFPFFEIPAKLRRKEPKIEREKTIQRIETPETKPATEKYDRSLESELQHIQNRLREIERA